MADIHLRHVAAAKNKSLHSTIPQTVEVRLQTLFLSSLPLQTIPGMPASLCHAALREQFDLLQSTFDFDRHQSNLCEMLLYDDDDNDSSGNRFLQVASGLSWLTDEVLLNALNASSTRRRCDISEMNDVEEVRR